MLGKKTTKKPEVTSVKKVEKKSTTKKSVKMVSVELLVGSYITSKGTFLKGNIIDVTEGKAKQMLINGLAKLSEK